MFIENKNVIKQTIADKASLIGSARYSPRIEFDNTGSIRASGTRRKTFLKSAKNNDFLACPSATKDV